MKKALLLLLFFVSGQAIAQNNPITSITISLPANPDASLANGAVLSEANVMDAINFRWTPVIPKPRESEHRLVLKHILNFIVEHFGILNMNM